MAVAAVAADDVWAVGDSSTNGTAQQPLLEHWDGRQWQVVPGPILDTRASFLASVAAVRAANVWAVGYAQDAGGSWQTLIVHWDGTQWWRSASPNGGARTNELLGVTALAANGIWATGYYRDMTGHLQPFVLRSTNTCGSAMPTATGPPRTPTPTATTCPLYFTDVTPGSPF